MPLTQGPLERGIADSADKTSVICAYLRNLKHQLPCEKRSAMKGSGCGSCRYAVTAPRFEGVRLRAVHSAKCIVF